MRKLNLLLVMLVCFAGGILLAATAAAAKHPPHAAAPTAALTATYDTSAQHLSISGCGYTLAGVQVVYTHPDATTETWYMGVWNDDAHGAGCLDSNYILASATGTWTISTFQAGLPVASTTVDLP